MKYENLEQYHEFIDQDRQENVKEAAILHRILDEMYKHAEPGMDYKEALRQGERDDGVPRYSLHYLGTDMMEQIIEDYLKDMELMKKGNVRRKVLLGAAPSNSRQAVNEKRLKTGLEPIGGDE